MKNQPKVSIISYTGIGTNDPEWYAARLLAFTKNTRLKMTPDGLESFFEKPIDEIKKELAYMATTIPSAWEFVDVIFSIEDVSIACAQQITRTRNAVYQMQSQRVTDMSTVGFHIPESIKDKHSYTDAMKMHIQDYTMCVEQGDESLEDARGLLPINVHCNLLAKYNLRSLVELLRARDSMRVQGEYQSIAAQMKAGILEIWPWSESFFVPKDKQVIDLIEEVAKELSSEQKMKLAKAADLLKKS